MKHILLATTAVLSLAVTTPAKADGMSDTVGAGAWYVSADLGVNWLQNTSPNTAFGDQLNTDFDSGWALTGAVGYHWTSGFRGEIEIGYRKNEVDSIVDAPNGGLPINYTRAGGDVSQFSLMANAFYDMTLSPQWFATIGGGIGGADADISAHGAGNNLVHDADDNWSFAFQLVAGLGYRLNERTDMFVQYRYFGNNDHQVTTYPTGTPLRDSIDLDNNTVSAGFRYGM